MRSGDIIFFVDDVGQVLDVDYPTKGMTSVEWLEGDGESFVPSENLKHFTVLTSQQAKFNFILARSIHKRLNRLAKV
jgi:hypothetical protein